MATTRTEQITASDGSGRFAGTVTLPDAGAGPGLVLCHEIFGVNDYVEDVGRRLADLGYITLAPDLFWRLTPGVRLGVGDDDLAAGLALGQRFDREAAVGDLLAALAHLRSLPEVAGGAGVIGFCFGGDMAVITAVHGDPHVAVSYYGSGVPAMVGLLDRVRCPILAHFGGADPYIPVDGVAAVTSALAGRSDAHVVVQPGGGHAFDNWTNPRFSQPEPAAAAWAETVAFLRLHLPAG